MVDFSRLEPVSWPLRVGGQLVHKSWENQSGLSLLNEAVRVLYLTEDDRAVCTSGTSDYKYTYSFHSFNPLCDWFYLNSKIERKKIGFGKFISRIEQRESS